MMLAEIAHEAGLPDGVLNCVQGLGEDAGKSLTEHAAIKAVAFVGESLTGSHIMRQGADTLKRVHFELGGKNPVIVFADADLDRALDAVVFMIYSLNGERCTSSSRLLRCHRQFCKLVVYWLRPAITPPSTSQIAPVTQLASSERRNAITEATSLGLPILPIG